MSVGREAGRQRRPVDLPLQLLQLLGRHDLVVFEQAQVLQAREIDQRLDRDAGVVDRPITVPISRPGGSTPPRPEVTHGSPTARRGLSGRKTRAGRPRVVAGEDRLIARRFDHHRNARVEVGQQQHARAAAADLDHAPDQAAFVDRGHAPSGAVLGPDVEQHRVHERAAGIGDDAAGDRGRQFGIGRAS